MKRCLIYLDKWYEFDNSIYKQVNILTMDEEIDWNELKVLGTLLNVPMNEDNLYDGYSLLREVREAVASKTKSRLALGIFFLKVRLNLAKDIFF